MSTTQMWRHDVHRYVHLSKRGVRHHIARGTSVLFGTCQTCRLNHKFAETLQHRSKEDEVSSVPGTWEGGATHKDQKERERESK